MRTATMFAAVAALAFVTASAHAQSTAVTPPGVTPPSVTPPAASLPSVTPPSAGSLGQDATRWTGSSAPTAGAASAATPDATGYDVKKAKPKAKKSMTPDASTSSDAATGSNAPTSSSSTSDSPWGAQVPFGPPR